MYLVYFAISKHTKSLQIGNQIGRRTIAVGGGWYKYVVYTYVPGTRQICLRRRGAFYVFDFLPPFSHTMRTLRMSTAVVPAALLGAVIGFCLGCLVCGLSCCRFCLPWVCCGIFVRGLMLNQVETEKLNAAVVTHGQVPLPLCCRCPLLVTFVLLQML